MMLMSQSLSTYSLVQCIVSAAQFTSGAISFYDTYAELTATDPDGVSTSPLRVEYDVLEHFRVVRAQGVMRLTLPREVVRGWAAQNAFEAQLDECEGGQRSVRDGSHADAGAVSAQVATVTALLLVQLSAEDMTDFLQSIAPLIAASRRTRSVSRISVTEPLPVHGVPLVDPAASVPTESTTSSRAMSTASAASQEEAAESDWTIGKRSAAPMCDRSHYQHQRQGRSEREATHCVPSIAGDTVGQRRGCLPAEHAESRLTVVAPDDAAVRATDTRSGLLGGDSAIEVTEERAVDDAAQPLSGSLALPAGGEGKEGGCIGRRASRAAGALASIATAATGAAAPVDQLPPSPKHQHPQQATPPRLANTLESVAEELAGLVEEAEQPGLYRGGYSKPLHRRRPTSAAVMMAELRAGLQQTSGCAHRRPLPVVASTTTPSVCPSLRSTASETHPIWRPQRLQSPSAASAKMQCELDGVHAAAAAADDDTSVKNRRPTKQLVGVIAYTQEECLLRVVGRNGGGAHLCASELSSTPTAEVPRLPTHGKCDDCATPQNSRAMLPPAAEKSHDGADKAATAAGAALFAAQAVRRVGDGWGGSETRWAALPAGTVTHTFAGSGKVGGGGGGCAAPAAAPARRSPQPLSAASSVRLGDMLAVPDAARKPNTAAEGVVAPARRTVQFQSYAAGAVSSKPPKPTVRSSGVADVAAYLRELFPVEEAVPKPARQRRKAPKATAAGAVRGLSVCRPRRRAPTRRAIDSIASFTDAAAPPAVASTAAPSTTADGDTVSPLPVKSAPSPLLSVPTNVSEDISAAAGKRRRRSLTADAVGAAKKRANVRTTATELPSRNGIDAVQGTETSIGARRGSGTGEDCVAVRLPKPPQPKALSAFSVPQRVAIAVRDASALGLAQTTLPLCGATSATKSSTVVTTFVSPTEEAAADTAVEEGSAASLRSGDAVKVAGAVVIRPRSESDSREVAKDAAHHRRTQLPRAQLFTREAAPPAVCTDDPWRYRAGAAAADHHDQNGDDASISSSQATCPLLYCRESRKERSRRVLRYMNLISQSMAAMHETHDALRGLLLLMMGEGQL
ncbi:hypothetical protein GH5_03512 [Leishmania sp. Ghana 2012 LV757]|uniref:hypothetical protein n=1 Tax=Leishmania sp. Ghana 2012 LV757 TaxID=2803181 RepID=UPI001B77CB37|nr:hypothetical protein GH5_03512 [Leishmania sp. Ghana 2012 LV757]